MKIRNVVFGISFMPNSFFANAQDTRWEFAQKHTGKEWYKDFKLLYDMITDSHFIIDGSTYISIAGALAYVVFPIDIIPDFILGVGYIDDVFVVGMVMKSISEEIERYKTYQEGIKNVRNTAH